MFTIVGSGFGLYGYLPAIVEALGEPVLLPEAYRARLDGRPELEPYRASVRWMHDREAALTAATGAVLAVPPVEQPALVAQCLRREALATLVLEKPVAVSPARAAECLEELERSGRRYRVGYSFLHADWRGVALGGDEPVDIEWTFMAHHFAHGHCGWKRRHDSGGGALRFFGIHLIAWLAWRGYRDADGSVLAGEAERWSARFSGAGLPECRVRVDSRCALARFAVRCGSAHPAVEREDPFGAARRGPGHADPRIGVLRRLMGSLAGDDAPYRAAYREANRLWARVEAATAVSSKLP